MRVLFLHPNFPAQFGYLALDLVRQGGHEIVFGTQRQEGAIKGVKKLLYQPARKAHPHSHHYVKNLENAVLEGQAVYRMLEKLKRQGLPPLWKSCF